jgi:hypothetical protein
MNTDPLTFADIWTPALPVPLAFLVLLEAELFNTIITMTELFDQTFAIRSAIRRGGGGGSGGGGGGSRGWRSLGRWVCRRRLVELALLGLFGVGSVDHGRRLGDRDVERVDPRAQRVRVVGIGRRWRGHILVLSTLSSK